MLTTIQSIVSDGRDLLLFAIRLCVLLGLVGTKEQRGFPDLIMDEIICPR